MFRKCTRARETNERVSEKNMERFDDTEKAKRNNGQGISVMPIFCVRPFFRHRAKKDKTGAALLTPLSSGRHVQKLKQTSTMSM